MIMFFVLLKETKLLLEGVLDILDHMLKASLTLIVLVYIGWNLIEEV